MPKPSVAVFLEVEVFHFVFLVNVSTDKRRIPEPRIKHKRNRKKVSPLGESPRGENQLDAKLHHHLFAALDRLGKRSRRHKHVEEFRLASVA